MKNGYLRQSSATVALACCKMQDRFKTHCFPPVYICVALHHKTRCISFQFYRMGNALCLTVNKSCADTLFL